MKLMMWLRLEVDYLDHEIADDVYGDNDLYLHNN